VTSQPEHFSKAMALVKEVLDGKKSLTELKIWYNNFRLLFASEMLSNEKYKEHFLDGNIKGFSEICPRMPAESVRAVSEKFWKDRMDYKFNFFPKEISEHAAFIHGYKVGILAARLYDLRNRTQ
jgi:hypothetical protein